MYLFLTLIPLALGFPFLKSTPISSSDLDITCIYAFQCGFNGNCVPIIGSNSSQCICNAGFVTVVSDGTCNYQQTSQLEAFVVSFLAGYLGVDWFFLAKGNVIYTIFGVLKCLTFGCFITGLLNCLTFGCIVIWYVIDWMRIIFNSFPDGNGIALASW